MVALEVFGSFWGYSYYYYHYGSRSSLIIILFSYDFPYIFSNIFTVSIAIDKLCIIVLQNSHKHIILKKRLKIIMPLLLTFSIGYCCVTTYYSLPERCCNIIKILGGGFLAVFIMSMILVISTYIYILSIGQKSSKTMLACKHRNGKSYRRHSTTIFYTLACQVVFLFRYLTLFSLHISSISFPFNTIGLWLVMLRNCQCFCNGFVFLPNKEKEYKEIWNFWRKLKRKTKIVQECSLFYLYRMVLKQQHPHYFQS